jgi:hypothetical protein
MGQMRNWDFYWVYKGVALTAGSGHTETVLKLSRMASGARSWSLQAVLLWMLSPF